MDSATPPAPNGDAPGSGARLDDKEIWRLKHEEHLPHTQIMQRVGCAKGSVTKALQREEARRDQQPDTANRNGDAPGGPTEATPGQTPAVAAALSKAHQTVLQATDAPDAELLDDEQARFLDTRLRTQARVFDDSWEQLRLLIEEARTGQIHARLGFRSWPEYLADVVSQEMPNLARSVDQRRQMVELLAGEGGMSDRAAAAALGVSKTTINRDQDAIEAQLAHDVPVELDSVEPRRRRTGLDGKKRPGPKPKPTPNSVDKPDLVDMIHNGDFEEIKRVFLDPDDDAADEDDTDDAIQAHHDYQVRELDSAAEHLEDAACIFQYELDNGLVLSPEEVRELAERIDPAITQLLMLQEQLDAAVVS